MTLLLNEIEQIENFTEGATPETIGHLENWGWAAQKQPKKAQRSDVSPMSHQLPKSPVFARIRPNSKIDGKP